MKKLFVAVLVVVMSISVAATTGYAYDVAEQAAAAAKFAEAAAKFAEAAAEYAASLAALVPSEPTEPVEIKYKAGFVTQAMSNASQAFSWKEFQRLAPFYGFEMQVFAGENEPQVEVAGIEQCIAEGFDAVFINPTNIQSIVPAIMQAKEAGVIVGMFSSEPPEGFEDYVDFFCGSDDFLGAEQAGKFVSQNFPNGAKFVEVGGQAGHDAQIKRTNGFRAGIADNIIELDAQNAPTGWNTQEALAIMEDFIVRYGEENDVVFCHWDHGAAGVIEALKNAGIEKDIFVIGVDGNSTGYAQVRSGAQALCVGQSFTEMARKSLQNAKTMLEGGTVPVKMNFIPHDMVTLDTIDSFPEPEW